jgi:CheY-like chemotaxis protein
MDKLIGRSLTQNVIYEETFSEDLWLTEIDPGDLQDVILNLMLNSHDAMPDGGKVTINVHNCTLDAVYCNENPGSKVGDYVELIISDNGIGIASEIQTRVFDPFFTTKPQGKGTGLGLAMVFGFVKRSNGYISLNSKIGLGTTFHIYLPRSQSEKALQIKLPQQISKQHSGHETILVVDDELSLLMLSKKSLQSLGYKVLTAANAGEALGILEENTVNVLFSDVIMPGISGYQLAERVSVRYPDIKILLTSGYSDSANTCEKKKQFDVDIITKPYTQAELLQKLKELMLR